MIREPSGHKKMKNEALNRLGTKVIFAKIRRVLRAMKPE
jgi:hypothetical protein